MAQHSLLGDRLFVSLFSDPNPEPKPTAVMPLRPSMIPIADDSLAFESQPAELASDMDCDWEFMFPECGLFPETLVQWPVKPEGEYIWSLKNVVHAAWPFLIL